MCSLLCECVCACAFVNNTRTHTHLVTNGVMWILCDWISGQWPTAISGSVCASMGKMEWPVSVKHIVRV